MLAVVRVVVAVHEGIFVVVVVGGFDGAGRVTLGGGVGVGRASTYFGVVVDVGSGGKWVQLAGVGGGLTASENEIPSVTNLV